MAGIKNPYQAYGATPFDPIQGKSIEDRHVQMQLRQLTPYCRLCGNEIVDSNIDEHGHSVSPEWERAYRVHYRCYMKKVGQ